MPTISKQDPAIDLIKKMYNQKKKETSRHGWKECTRHPGGAASRGQVCLPLRTVAVVAGQGYLALGLGGSHWAALGGLGVAGGCDWLITGREPVIWGCFDCVVLWLWLREVGCSGGQEWVPWRKSGMWGQLWGALVGTVLPANYHVEEISVWWHFLLTFIPSPLLGCERS